MATPLKNCIRYWENTLFHNKFLMSPSTQELVGSTIAHLKVLEAHQHAESELEAKDAETSD